MARATVRSWMWAEACERIERAERLRRQFFHPHAAPHPSWEPPIDLYECGANLCVVVALPGVRQDGLEVLADDDGIVVAGERPLPPEARRAQRVRRLEIPHGRFERHIALPPGRYTLERQALADGCLVLTLKRGEQ